MKFNDIPADILSLRMTQASSDGKLEEAFITQISQSATDPGEYELYTSSSLILAQPVDNRLAANLDRELSSDPSYLARITDIDAEGGFALEVAFFAKETLEIGEQDIGVDEYVAELMGNIMGLRYKATVNDWLCKQLEDEFCFKRGRETYFFTLVGASMEGEIEDAETEGLWDSEDDAQVKNNEQEDEVPEEHRELKFDKSSSFCVVSSDASFVATEKPVSKGGSVYVATKLHRRSGESDKAIRLAHGKLNFVDWSAAGQVQVLARYQLKDIVQEDSSYLKTWDDFGNIEGEILLREAREFGVIYYNNAEENRDGTVTVTITQASHEAFNELAAGRVEGLERVETEPRYISNPKMTFEEFSKAISKSTWRRQEYCKIVRFDESASQITLDCENLLSESGKFIMPLQGDITQIRRRNSARRSILEGRSANPQLGLLLEENGRLTSLRLPKKVKPLTSFVRNKVFKNDPTYMQEKAIEVALNTPDIALIQGPPGTGKTTVIAAIVERLNQESTKTGSDAKGQVLLTGFQHDAVENMIGRISLNSMPVPKIGNRRSGLFEEDATAFERSLDEWCEQIVAGIREKYPDLEEAAQYKEIDILAAQYAMAPTQALGATLAGMIANIPPSVIGGDLVTEAEKLVKELSTRVSVASDGGSKYVRAARLIRESDEAFLDDGPDRADEALDVLGDELNEEEWEILHEASLWTPSKGIPPFMDKIRDLKKTLMVRFTAPPTFRVEKENQEMLDLLIKYENRIEAATTTNKDMRMAAIAEFVAELENNSIGIIDAVSEYSFAFAATCQQSVGTKMQDLKGVRKGDDSAGLVYDYVIVDEAARVSPRDLMIPMAQGKRIVLVGDHRQLPHIIDEEVAQQMEEGESDDSETEWLKKSMFEYLFTERLKSLELQDGIQRRVTLDKQFRMHPLIGDFISRNFYERFDAAERVSSGLPAEAFAHNLPHTGNKPIAWLEVPGSLGGHVRRGTSWIRQAEIDAIADQLFEWMSSEEGENLTFGVISFYKAQADLIRRALNNLGADASRLRVGTVDSFQGMEFDVVFLSMVRALPEGYQGTMMPRRQTVSQRIESEEEQRQGRRSILSKMRSALSIGSSSVENPGKRVDEGIGSAAPVFGGESHNDQGSNSEERKGAQRLFGHLCLYNRLNVSMSRQKRLLVVAGDSGLLHTDLAAKYIPGLVDFYETCKTEGVIIQCQQ